MAATRCRRILIFVLCLLPALFAQEYVIPEVTIQALKPRGVKISIPDNPRMGLFAFQGNVNREIKHQEVGSISGEASRPRNGFWTIQDDAVVLKPGDIINYYVHVNRNGQPYKKDKLSYTVEELIDPDAPSPGAAPAPEPAPATAAPATSAPVPATLAPSPDCRPTVTMIRNGTVCAGQIIFEDQFDTLDEDRWKIEQYVPEEPDYPFLYYVRPPNVQTVSVEVGALRIEPKFQPSEEEELFTVKTDIEKGCTRASNFCDVKNKIIPPIVSGQVTTNTFMFKYGLIEIRARLPKGDWIYPDLLLEPFWRNQHGREYYSSGVIRIAGALGNSELTKGPEDYGNKVLYGGPIMDFKCRRNLLVRKRSEKEWSNDFHLYALRWAPDSITLMVDGEEFGRIEAAGDGLHARLPKDCNPPRTLLKTPMAPFDDFFRITLGVAVGGITEFPDDSLSQNLVPKPWSDGQVKAKVKFVREHATWLPTWVHPALIVDYVRVRAL